MAVTPNGSFIYEHRQNCIDDAIRFSKFNMYEDKTLFVIRTALGIQSKYHIDTTKPADISDCIGIAINGAWYRFMGQT